MINHASRFLASQIDSFTFSQSGLCGVLGLVFRTLGPAAEEKMGPSWSVEEHNLHHHAACLVMMHVLVEAAGIRNDSRNPQMQFTFVTIAYHSHEAEEINVQLELMHYV